jgi:protein-S-isoprenylcysteine O-methyltransferase Ste14
LKTVFHRKGGVAALLIERFLLSIVFFYFGVEELKTVRGIWSAHPKLESSALIEVGRHSILLVSAFFSGAMLLLARRAAAPPGNLKLVLVPLATTFFYLTYFAVHWFPPSWRVNLAPSFLQGDLVVAGIFLTVIGHLIALWGILYLRRSFGVFVAVRKVVLGGPYRWVRHPMYLGWIFFCIGIAVANFSLAYFFLIAIHISLLIYRARLEENEIARQSPEYREHMKDTGFIFPVFWD